MASQEFHSHDQDPELAQGDSDEEQLRLGREMVSAATGGRPDFEGFIESLRAEADGTAAIWAAASPRDRASKDAEISSLRQLADRIELIGARLGFL